MQQASDYELELMKIIWANNNTAMYTNIVQGLEGKGLSWTKNTIITLLSRLIDKGMLTISKKGRKNIYNAIVAQNDYQADQTERFISKIFEGNTKGLVAALIDKDMISSADYDELKKHWDDSNKKGSV